jgi:hypothetical protein
MLVAAPEAIYILPIKIDNRKIGNNAPINPVAPPTKGPVIATRRGIPFVIATNSAHMGAIYITDIPLNDRKIRRPNATTIDKMLNSVDMINLL